MVEINFDMSESQAEISVRSAEIVLQKILQDHDFRNGWVSVVIVGDTLIKKLHQDYLNDPETTDVLSFEFEINREKGYIEGEVYANVEQVGRQAEDYDASPEKELMRVICHGILHLAGYDDATPEQRAAMREKEDYYLRYY